MSSWKEPRSDYTKESQVTPEIFNTLGENEKYLNEIVCNIELKKQGNETAETINRIVLMEV